MAITNHERVGKALDLLKAGLGPFIDPPCVDSSTTRAGVIVR